MDFIVEFLVDVLGEVAFEALAPAFFAVIWAAGAFCLFYPATHGAAPWIAALAAFFCGLWLTYLWRTGSKWARKTLIGGALVGIVPMVALLARALPPR